MIYNDKEKYKVKFYYNKKTGKAPVRVYLDKTSKKQQAKMLKYIEFLRENKGVLDEPYAKHIKGKIRELRVDFGRNKHRIFFFTFVARNIILLHAFHKKTAKTPEREIRIAEIFYRETLSNKDLYEK